MKILAIESSCDETAAALIGEKDGKPTILSNIISSQIDLHAKTGGVVPEVASRAHMEAILPVIIEALTLSKAETINYQSAIDLLDYVTHIAVTTGPGLIGSLLVGFNAAKTLAYARELPIIPINHIEGHLYSAFIDSDNLGVEISFPVIALTVSGGHTSLTLMRDHGDYQVLGETLDDAVGEAYDKVAKMLGLGYPGGPIISKLAGNFRKNGDLPTITFPRPILHDGTLNFSFSGLKTAVLQKTLELKKKQYHLRHPELVSGSGSSARLRGDRIPDQVRNDIQEINLASEVKEEIAFAFEEAVADVLVAKASKAVKEHSPATFVFAGGVSANSYLRDRLQKAVEETGNNITVKFPNKDLCGDNAAMIGVASYYHIKNKDIKNWNQIDVDSNFELV